MSYNSIILRPAPAVIHGLVAGVLSFAACATSHAELIPIASDNFTGDGTSSSISGATGGTGWTSPWTQGVANPGASWSVSSLSSASYPGVSGPLGQMIAAPYGPYDNYRALPLQNSGNVYIEVLANWADYAGNGFGDIRLGLSSGGGPPYADTGYILSSAANASIYFNTGGTWGIGVVGASSSYGTKPLGTQALLLEQINYTTGTSKLWVDPNLSTFNYVNPTTTPDATVDAAPEFNALEFLDVDGTVNDVSVFSAIQPAPEPSSLIGGALVLLAFGAGSLRKFRQQKQA